MQKKRLVLAPDSFKGSLTAAEVAEAMARGFQAASPTDELIQIPLADGGEGTVAAMLNYQAGVRMCEEVSGPLGQKIKATYGIIDEGRTAVIELASASGLTLLAPADYNPLLTTTYGTGELILAALNQGVSKIILGLGGSGTNDGGSGLARALGVRFFDWAGVELADGGGALNRLHHLELEGLDARVRTTEFVLATDVNNPLCGPRGASFVFGPQKGGTPLMLKQLDANLAHYAALLDAQLGIEVKDIPGSGAAGGAAASLLAFTTSSMQAGVDLLIETSQLAKQLQQADYVIVGEGRIDQQTAYGKTIAGVAKVAKELGVPVIALAGQVEGDLTDLYAQGVTAIFSISPGVIGLSEAQAQSASNLSRTCENLRHLM